MDPIANDQVVAELGYGPALMYFLAIFFSILSTLAVTLRIKSRHALHVPLEADDYMILPALIFTIATGVLMIVGVTLGTLGQHTQIDSTGNPVINTQLAVFLGTTFGNQLSTVLAIGATKLSVLLFYRRIFKGKIFNIITIALMALVTAWIITFFFANLFECMPISTNWTGTGGAPPPICINETPMYYAEAYSDVATDLLILITPIPMIWTLQMPLGRKVAVSGVFFLGALTIAASIARLYVYYNVGSNLFSSPDISYFLTPVVFWPMIECSLGVLGACLPTLWPLFRTFSIRRLYGKISLKSRFSTWSGKGSQSLPFKLNSDDSSSIYSHDGGYGDFKRFGRSRSPSRARSPGVGFKEAAAYTSYIAQPIVQPAYHIRAPPAVPVIPQPPLRSPQLSSAQISAFLRSQPLSSVQKQVYVHQEIEVASMPRPPPTIFRVGEVPSRNAVFIQGGYNMV